MTEERFTAGLRSLVERDGPFVSLYLNTEASTEEGARELELRWRAFREEAVDQGAPEDTLARLDDVVGGAQRRGDGLVAIAARDDIGFAATLPTPVRDRLRVGSLPHLVPLLEWRQDNPRLAVVLSDRVGAQIHVLGGLEPDSVRSVEGDDFPITKVRAGGSSEARFHRRAESNWEGNAKEVVAELHKILATEDIDFVVISGDVRAIGFLQQHLDEGVDTVTLEIESRPEVGLEEIIDELEPLAAAHTGQLNKNVLEQFQEERGQQGLAVEGLEATFAAVRMAQIDTLLLSRDLSGPRAWFSRSDLTQAALSASTLTDLGLEDTSEADVADVLVRTALGTSARVAVIPGLSDRHGPREGVGALLRFRT